MKLRPEHQPKNLQKLEKTAEIVHNLETAQDDVLFDPERDISEEVWQKILEQLWDCRRFGYWLGFSHLAAEIALLSPHRAAQLFLNKATWQEMKQIHNDRAYSPENQKDEEIKNETFLIFAANMLRCFPEKRQELHLEDKKWEEAIKDVELRTTDMQLALMILYPDRRYLPYSEEEYMIKLEKYIISHTSPSAPDIAAVGTLFFPQCKKEIDNKAKVLWEMMKEKFNKLQASDILVASDFLQLCRDMTILAAEDAKITADGRIQITPKTKPLKSNEPLPQRPI